MEVIILFMRVGEGEYPTRARGKSSQVTPKGLKCDEVSQDKQNKSHSTQKRKSLQHDRTPPREPTRIKKTNTFKTTTFANLLKPVNKTQEGLKTG